MTQPHQISRKRKRKTPVQVKAVQESQPSITWAGPLHPGAVLMSSQPSAVKEDLLPSPPGPKDGVPAVGQGRCHPK